MRRWILVALAVVLLAPTALGQVTIVNLDLGAAIPIFVSAGELVTAQEVRVEDVVTQTRQPTVATGLTWNNANNGLHTVANCADTGIDGATLQLGTFGFAIPVAATILGITVEVLGLLDDGLAMQVQLVAQGTPAPIMKEIDAPVDGGGTCANVAWDTVGGNRDLWGRGWTPAQINGDFRVDITADLVPPDIIHVDQIKVHVTYAVPSTIQQFVVRNAAGGGNRLLGEHISKIEVFRVRDSRVLGSQTTTAELAKLTTTGVPITILGANQAFTGEERLRIRIQLKSDVPLGTVFWLGDTIGTIAGAPINVNYAGAAAENFEVGPSPGVFFDGSVPDADVYPGQKFLAGRIAIQAFNTPFELEIDEILLMNNAAGTRLAGTHLSALEIRRASDNALLGQASTTELAKLTTDGTKITMTSNNRISAYGSVLLEVWVTLKTTAPTGRQLQLADHILIGGANFQVGDNFPAGDVAPIFDVGVPGGFEEVNNLELAGGRIYSGQRFLAQRVEVIDDDFDPYNVTTTSVSVENIANAGTRLAENQIAKIEVVRARDGALMGETTNTAGLNAGGVRIPTTTANLAGDDTVEVIEIWVTLKSNVPHERLIQLQTTIWHTENTRDFGFPAIGPNSAEFETGPAVGQGFEEADPIALPARGVFQGVRFLAQEVKLVDDDLDPYGITIMSLMIRNMAPDNRLSSNNVSRVEVRRKSDGLLLGEVIDPINLHLAGERVTTGSNNTLLDDDMVELQIWLTLKDPIPFGRKIKLEAIVWHQEGTVTFETAPLVEQTTFTTEQGDPPTNVDFTWAPVDPAFTDEITFTPAANIADPEGAIANATFAWDFGDGSAVEQTTGTAAVTHTYAGGGTFDVTLTVTGEDGLSSTKTRQVEVEGPPNETPVVTITADPQSPAVGANVDFTATITDADQPAGVAHVYAWDFKDGGTSALAAPQHAFAAAGTFAVELTVTDDAGATATATIDVSVGNEPPTLTGVTATPATSSTGDAVAFAAQGYADPDADPLGEYRWDFGDGTTTTTPTANTTHVYGAPGTFTVTVTAVDDRGAVSDPETVVVTVAGPVRVIVYGFPNPASTVATITWFMPQGATDPILRIYNLLRRLVFEQELPDGASQFAWNLRDGDGAVLSNGLYFCVVSATSAAGRTVSSETFRLLIAR